MRLSIAIVCVLGGGACERAVDATPPTARAPSSPTPVPVDAVLDVGADLSADVERLRAELASLTDDDCVYLADLGCFSSKHYQAYEGRNPRTGERVLVPAKTLAFFVGDRALRQVVAGATPEPDDAETRAWKAKTHRPWADALAKHTRERLLADRVAELPGIGTLRIQPRASTGQLDVFFEADGD